MPFNEKNHHHFIGGVGKTVFFCQIIMESPLNNNVPEGRSLCENRTLVNGLYKLKVGKLSLPDSDSHHES